MNTRLSRNKFVRINSPRTYMRGRHVRPPVCGRRPRASSLRPFALDAFLNELVMSATSSSARAAKKGLTAIAPEPGDPPLQTKLKFQLPPVIVLVMEGRGGVGKSTIAELCITALRNHVRAPEDVAVLETDFTNSSMRLIGSSELIKVAGHDVEAAFLDLPERIRLGECRHIVVDFGARDEARVRPCLPELAERAKECGATLVIMRPFVDALFVTNNCASFVREVKTPIMPVILAWNLGVTDSIEDFDRWKGSEARASMLAVGVQEVVIDHLGIKWSNAAKSFGLSFIDVARGQFDRIQNEEDRADAEQLFDRVARLHFARWTLKQTTKIEQAFFDATRS